MTDRDDRRDQRHRDPTEGVRLLGADEAAEALERDDIRHRFAEGQPRFGDRPAAPPAEGPRPALRFPLGSYDDPNSIERPPVVPVQRPTDAPELSHWAGSAAEEVPHMSGRDPRQGDDTWSGYDADPRWRDEPTRGPAPGPSGWPAPAPSEQTGGGRGAPPAYEAGVDPSPGRSVFDSPPQGGPAAAATTRTATPATTKRATRPATPRRTTTSTTTRSTTSRRRASPTPAAGADRRWAPRRAGRPAGRPTATCARRSSSGSASWPRRWRPSRCSARWAG